MLGKDEAHHNLKSIFFLKFSLEDIIKLIFTPGVLVAVFESSESGITPLMVLPQDARAVEEGLRKYLAAK